MTVSEIRTLFATSLRKWRTRRGFSQEVLAERANLHRTYISDVERGARNLSLESIDKLARALEISVSTLFTPQETAAPGTAAPVATAPELVEIILVEATAADAELALNLCKKAQIANPIRVIRDVNEATEFFFGKGVGGNSGSDGRQQIILLDLNLPKVAGMELLRRLKADPKTRQSPLVIVAGSERDMEIAECRRLGVQAFLIKPLTLQGLTMVAPEIRHSWALFKPSGAGSVNDLR